MKAFSIVLLIFGLQMAMSPLCLCLGAGLAEKEAVPSCCHAPEPGEPAPCPHCDQELPLSATAPAKASFDAEPPEWHGFPDPSIAEPIHVAAVYRQERVHFPPGRGPDPPPLPILEFFEVFLI